jgi:hypothetical protein
MTKDQLREAITYIEGQTSSLMELQLSINAQLNKLFQERDNYVAILEEIPLTDEERYGQFEADERAWERKTRRAESGYAD